MINKDELPREVAELMESILSRNPKDMTAKEVAFLKSRIAYLSDKEKASLPEVIEIKGASETETKPAKKKAKRKYL